MMLRGYDHALFYHFCFASQYMAICLYTAIRVHNALWLYVAMLVYMDDLPFPWYVVIQWSAMNVCVHVKHFWDRCCNALTNYPSHLNLYHSSCDEVGYQFGPWNLVLYYFIFLSNGKAIQSCILTMFQSHNRPTCLTVARSQPAAFVFQRWRRNWAEADCSFAVAAWIADHLSVTLLFFPLLPHSSSSPLQTMCDESSHLSKISVKVIMKPAKMSVTRAFFCSNSEYKQVEYSCCNFFTILTWSQCQYRDLFVVPFFRRHSSSSITWSSISWVCYKHLCFVCVWPDSSRLDRRALVDDHAPIHTNSLFCTRQIRVQGGINRAASLYQQVW